MFVFYVGYCVHCVFVFIFCIFYLYSMWVSEFCFTFISYLLSTTVAVYMCVVLGILAFICIDVIV